MGYGHVSLEAFLMYKTKVLTEVGNAVYSHKKIIYVNDWRVLLCMV